MDEAGFYLQLLEKIQSFSATRIEALAPDDNILSSGLIDSTNIVEIIVLVEEYWGIQVDPADLSMDNFDSMAAIVRYVRGKLGAGT